MGIVGIIALIAVVAVQQVSADFPPGIVPPNLNPNCPSCRDVFVGDRFVILEICSDCPCTITVTHKTSGKVVLGPLIFNSVRKGFCLCDTYRSPKTFTPLQTYIWTIDCGFGRVLTKEITEGGVWCPSARVFGEPHWNTFDQLKYDFQGIAGRTYTWTKDCVTVNNPPLFEVQVTLGVSTMARGNSALTRVESVTIRAHGMVITLLSENMVKIDGTTYDSGDFQLSQYFNGQDIEIMAAVATKNNGVGTMSIIIVILHVHGIYVEYNGINEAELQPIMITDWVGTGKLCGLAGDTEDPYDTTNDLRNSSGIVVATDASDQSLVDDFGESWLVSYS